MAGKGVALTAAAVVGVTVIVGARLLTGGDSAASAEREIGLFFPELSS